jgi:glycosyltransferase involved in cell wall biosynthesis
MNIAIDLTPTPKTKAGVGRYLINLINNLQKLDNQNKYYLFIHDDDLDSFKATCPNFEVVSVKSKYLRNIWLRLLWEQFVLPSRLKKYKIDILHSPHYTIPYFSSVKKVVTYHDMTFILFPYLHIFTKRHLFKIYMWLSAKFADRIIAVSHATKDDVMKVLKVKESKISVAPLGVDQCFFEDPPDNAQEIIQSYVIDQKYFLTVGTIEPRKNMLGMLKAYAELPDEFKNEYKFVICGQMGWMYQNIFDFIKESDIENRVVFVKFVPDNHLPILYKKASIFLYTSFYEGFGLPVVEAMASGTPCITSNLSSMKEVAGDTCIKVDPNNHKEIAQAIMKILENEEFRNDLSKSEIKRAEIYNWPNCAKLTIDTYKSL